MDKELLDKFHHRNETGWRQGQATWGKENHRIGLEGTSRGRLVQACCSSRDIPGTRLLRAPSDLA